MEDPSAVMSKKTIKKPARMDRQRVSGNQFEDRQGHRVITSPVLRASNPLSDFRGITDFAHTVASR